MIRAVLDSSVLFSAFIKPDSPPATLLRRAREGAFVLYLSPYILNETSRVLLRDRHVALYGFSTDKVARFRDALAISATMVEDLPTLDAVPGDPKDNPIVATAVVAGADYLVTGDRRHLLALREYAGTRIISPRAFLDLL